MERFNNLTVLVYNDRRARGKDFDQWFLWEMIESYGKIKMQGGKTSRQKLSMQHQQLSVLNSICTRQLRDMVEVLCA
jgi:murein tripeptide amidase MpaA